VPGNLHEDQLLTVTNDGIVWLWECSGLQLSLASSTRDLVITGMLQNLAFGLSSIAVSQINMEIETRESLERERERESQKESLLRFSFSLWSLSAFSSSLILFFLYQVPPFHEKDMGIAMLLGTFAGTIQLIGRSGMEFEHLVRPQVPIRGVRFVSNSEVLYYTSEEYVEKSRKRHREERDPYRDRGTRREQLNE
jgi:hypothetical protein